MAFLLRSHDPIPRAREALTFLQSQKIPFILLTNGGGKHESERVEEVSKKLHVPLNTSLFVQSHSPFADMEQFKDKTVMVVGGVEDKCRKVAERLDSAHVSVKSQADTNSHFRYGYKTVVTPADVFVQHPSIWPFSLPFLDYYRPFTRPLPQPIDPSDPTKTLKIDGIFVYNDPRDWGLDAAIIIDLLLSSGGKLGTISAKNNNPNLPNRGYQQDGQPPLYFCNPDLWWATNYHLSRLGQGAFRESLEGIWAAVTGGEKKGVVLNKEVIGKPFPKTFEFAEKKLIQHRKNLFQDPKLPSLKRVFMVGDNPGESPVSFNGIIR